MKAEKLKLSHAAIIGAESFVDKRGVFVRFICEKELSEIIGARHFVNVNLSRTLIWEIVKIPRFKYSPKAEIELVRCILDAAYCVISTIQKEFSIFLT